MKILIVGIDGLGWESLQRLGLKKLAQRITNAKFATPKIDNMVSRGWPEIYTGKNAYQSGAFYQAPEIRGGKIYPTQKTGLSHIKTVIPSEELLWNRLMEIGYSTAIFAVPTVSPPEKLNGFCVAATGGGKFGNSLSRSDIWPIELFDDGNITLSDIDLGLRMGYGAFLPNSLQELESAARRHLDSYFRLLELTLQKKSVDSLFLGSRFVNEMAYKFLGICRDDLKDGFENELKQLVLDLCSQFDERLDTFIETCESDHIFIVSDHGIGDFEFDLNLNELLFELGYIHRAGGYSGWKSLVRPAYNFYRRHLRGLKIGRASPKYDFSKSKAYSIGFTNVIYLNEISYIDGSEKRSKRSRELLEKLNHYAVHHGIEHLIKFELTKRTEERAGMFPCPVIKCLMNSGVSNTERVRKVISKRTYNYQEMFVRGFYGEHSGCKTEDTIAAYSGPRSDRVDLRELTSVYESIIRVARKSHS